MKYHREKYCSLIFCLV